MVATHPRDSELWRGAQRSARRIAGADKPALFISMENASPLSADPGLLAFCHRAGLRMLGITHTLNNNVRLFVHGPAGTEWKGLSDKARALVDGANRLGIVFGLSHAK